MFWGKERRGRERERKGAHHILHTDVNLSIAIEGAVEADDMRRIAFMKNFQFAYNLTSYGWFHFQMD